MAARINNKKDLDNYLEDLYYKFNDKKNGEREFKAAVKSVMRDLIGESWAKRSGAVKYLDSLYKSRDSLEEYHDDHMVYIRESAQEKASKAEQQRRSSAAASDRRVSRARESDARRRSVSRSRPRPRSRSRSIQGTTRAAGTMADDTSSAAKAARTLFGQKKKSKKSKKSKKIKRRKSKKITRRRKR